MSTGQLSLVPVAPFWVVKLGASGIHYGPFPKPEAEAFADGHGHPSSNFVIPVKPESELPLVSRLAALGRSSGASETKDASNEESSRV